LDGQRYRGCPVLKLGSLQNHYYPMSKMDRGFCRGTCCTIRRCLVCHFAAVAADEFKSFAHFVPDAPIDRNRKSRIGVQRFAIIRAASARDPVKSSYFLRLSPVYGRVTTALRSVVTRPPSDQASPHARFSPATQLSPICRYHRRSHVI
jgi:hypothetical protein